MKRTVAKATVKLDLDSPLFDWCIEWAAESLNRFRVMKNGKTPYEMVGARKSNDLPIACFGEQVLYIPLKAERKKEDKMVRCKYGIWLGLLPRSSEVVIGTSEGIVKARTIRRLTEDMRWNANALLQIKGRPRRPNPTIDSDQIPTMTTQEAKDDEDDGQNDDEDHAARVRPQIVEPENTETNKHAEPQGARDMYFTKAILDTYGRTEGCPGCSRAGKPHTAECRRRVMEAMSGSPSGQRKIVLDQARRQKTEAEAILRAAQTDPAIREEVDMHDAEVRDIENRHVGQSSIKRPRVEIETVIHTPTGDGMGTPVTPKNLTDIMYAVRDDGQGVEGWYAGQSATPSNAQNQDDTMQQEFSPPVNDSTTLGPSFSGAMLSHLEVVNCVVKTLNAVGVSEAYSPPRIVEEAIRAAGSATRFAVGRADQA